MALIDYSWHKVANAKPRMSSHVQVERHFYRRQPWYVLYDKASGRSHRFTSAVYRLLCLMNGERTLQQIWDSLQKTQNAPSKDEVLSAFSQLQMMELLQGDIAPGNMVLEERQKNWAKLRLRQRYGSPFSIRFALWDPDEFLQRFLPSLRLFFSPWFFVLWLGMVCYGIMLAAQNWALLTRDIADHILAPDNLVIMLLLFPIIKLLHELGHAFTTRRWGGEVHELGILILVFMPLPYVEASSASAFPDKRARILVSAAGIMVELFIAALAMVLWVSVEPGMVRAMAYNVMFICSISTLLFNGNPLLRFDGYYLLADAIEVPNLVSRATRYIGYLFQHYLLNVKEMPSPAASLGEAGWLLFYGVAAFFYRIFISAVIIFFVAGQFFIIGVLVAIWAVYLFLISPLIRNIRYFLNNPMLQKRKLRLIFVLGTLISVLVYGLFLLPIPFWSNVEGVIWPPEQSQVRVGASGFCEELLVKPGDQVATGEPLLVLKDELLETQSRILQYQLKELEAKYRYTSFWQKDRVAARMLREKIETVEADIAKHEEQMKRLVVRSPQIGQVYIPNADQLLGRFLQQGELVAYVVEPPVNIIRAVVQQKDIALVRDQGVSVEVRLAERLWQVYPAIITQAVPKASDYLPSRALGTAGGGSIPIDPNDEKGMRAYEPIFQFEIHLPDDVPISRIGGRAYLRFYHRKEPLASQWYRSIRQLFLRHFDI
jgi:putative peptide zinc metalloprotease protein